jgi:23S rRNA G2445 N2-methylase RlmL
MSRRRPEPELPPCYAMCQPGLEEVAADEITRDLGGDVRKTAPGLVVFRVDAIDRNLLRLRTTEDVYLLAWGTDQLTRRAVDLDQIERWTAREPDWDRLLNLHHAVRPRPKGRPSFRLVTQMEGERGYLRKHAQEALARGLAGKIPASWLYAEENAAVEVWLTIQGATAYCGVRLSDRTMRHRTYKVEHLPASLRPTVAAALVRLAGWGDEHVFLDPMCGAGTILAERLTQSRRQSAGFTPPVLGGDLDRSALRTARANLSRLGEPILMRWDVRRLPLADASIDRVVSNPPFGKQLSDPESIGPLYQGLVRECDRVLRPGGQVVLLVSDLAPLRRAAQKAGWTQHRLVPLRVLGQRAVISVWRKPSG